jgi:hypothetical protein
MPMHFPAAIAQTRENQLEQWTKTVAGAAAIMQR